MFLDTQFCWQWALKCHSAILESPIARYSPHCPGGPMRNNLLALMCPWSAPIFTGVKKQHPLRGAQIPSHCDCEAKVALKQSQDFFRWMWLACFCSFLPCLCGMRTRCDDVAGLPGQIGNTRVSISASLPLSFVDTTQGCSECKIKANAMQHRPHRKHVCPRAGHVELLLLVS